MSDPREHPRRQPSAARERLLAAAIEHLSEHGVGDQSLRQLASALDSSHRMLIYHFGSREALLAEVVSAIEARQAALLAEIVADGQDSPYEQGMQFWRRTVADARRTGPLFFELAGQAMQGHSHAAALRSPDTAWLEPLAQLWRRFGFPEGRAHHQARLNLAVARGLLLDLLLTGDEAAVEEAMRLFVETSMRQARGSRS